MSDPYLDVEAYKALSAMPSEDIDGVEARAPGFILKKLTANSSRINAQLSKRYETPFASPAPEIVQGWLAAMTDPEVYRKRGWNPGDDQVADIDQAAKDAREEMQLAADADNGLFELPLRADTSESGVSKGEPLAYSEASPYDWVDIQAEAVRGR